MSYNSNLSKINNPVGFFIRVQPRVQVTGIEVHAGSVYKTSWEYPLPRTVKTKGNELTQGSSASLSAGEYWYDSENEILYLRGGSSENLITSSFVTATFDLYHSTIEHNWYRDPTDDSSEIVFWHGDLIETPNISISTLSKKYGFVNLDATGFTIALAQDLVNIIVSEGSYNNVIAEVWHLVGNKEEISDYQKIFSGRIGENVDLRLNSCSFQLINGSSNLDGFIPYFRVGSTSQDFDPQYESATLTCFLGWTPDYTSGRYISGNVPNGVIGVNLDFEDSSPTTSDNRIFAAYFTKGSDGSDKYQASVSVSYTGGGSPLEKLLSLTNVKKFREGDFVRLDPTSGSDVWTRINAVDYSTGLIVFDDAIATGGGTILKYFCRNAYLIQNGVRYTLKAGRDFTGQYNSTSGCNTITLTSSAEANVSASTFNPSNGDYILMDVEGWPDFPTLNGTPIVAKNPDTSITDIFIIIYFYLKDILGFLESEIDTSALLELQTSENRDLDRFIFPGFGKSDTMLSRISVFDELLNFARCISFIGANGHLTFKNIDAAGTSTLDISMEEITEDSWSYSMDYRDIANFTDKIKIGEVTLRSSKAAVTGGYTSTSFQEITNYEIPINYSSDEIKYLHDVSGYTEKNLYSTNRKGLLTLTIPFKLAASTIGETVTVYSNHLPGFAISSGETNSRDFVIREITWTLDGTEVVLDDCYSSTLEEEV